MSKRLVTSILVVVFTLVASELCWAATYGGVEFPGGDASFADVVVSYTEGGGGVSGDHELATNALGIPNYNSVSDTNYLSLGWGGTVVLQFTNNSLTTSGTAENDLWIFEIGDAVEKTNVSISKDGTTWINVGAVAGSTRGVDLDAFIGSGVTASDRYSYVRLVDAGPHLSSAPYAGADIDAVGAISSAAPVPLPGTLLLFGSGLAALAGTAHRRLRSRS